MTPERCVQAQLDAYNAHDLDAFVDCFSDDVRLFRMPAATPPNLLMGCVWCL